jgi:mRNA interferase RelE/StbE
LAWTIKIDRKAEKELKALDKPTAKRIYKYLRRLENLPDPKLRGGSLTGPLSTYWKYRVGDYRIICNIDGAALTVLVINIAHRKHIYSKKN